MKRRNAPTGFLDTLDRAADVIVYECSGLMFWFTQKLRYVSPEMAPKAKIAMVSGTSAVEARPDIAETRPNRRD